ncbi:hypothetical protein C7B76_23930 [filamentous cyanobacterium CCP2]|jgi:hypothetical protein|nr:hypothetical protein C7B76_23930 [filamentous cyanobacterium CCP2]
MSPLFRPQAGISHTDDQPDANIAVIDVVSVPRVDRWRIYHRLQELKIPCWCLPDGSLHVKVQNGTGALLLRSVVQQFVASRPEMVNWLERCWDADRMG